VRGRRAAAAGDGLRAPVTGEGRLKGIQTHAAPAVCINLQGRPPVQSGSLGPTVQPPNHLGPASRPDPSHASTPGVCAPETWLSCPAHPAAAR
jgi:hypothetical protein